MKDPVSNKATPCVGLDVHKAFIQVAVLVPAEEDAAPMIREVIAPSLTPVKAGDRSKTDRRDALKLATSFLKANLLSRVAPPSESQETFRDIVGQREAAGKDLLWARHPLSKFVIRRQLGFVRKARCGQAHHRWLLAQRLGSFFDTAGFDDLYGQVVHQAERRDRLHDGDDGDLGVVRLRPLQHGTSAHVVLGTDLHPTAGIMARTPGQ